MLPYDLCACRWHRHAGPWLKACKWALHHYSKQALKAGLRLQFDDCAQIGSHLLDDCVHDSRLQSKLVPGHVSEQAARVDAAVQKNVPQDFAAGCVHVLGTIIRFAQPHKVSVPGLLALADLAEPMPPDKSLGHIIDGNQALGILKWLRDKRCRCSDVEKSLQYRLINACCLVWHLGGKSNDQEDKRTHTASDRMTCQECT